MSPASNRVQTRRRTGRRTDSHLRPLVNRGNPVTSLGTAKLDMAKLDMANLASPTARPVTARLDTGNPDLTSLLMASQGRVRRDTFRRHLFTPGR